MRSVCLLLTVLFGLPPNLPLACEEESPAATATGETHPTDHAPLPSHPDPGEPCEDCSGPACPSQRVCAGASPALAAGAPATALPPATGFLAAAAVTGLTGTPGSALFHPPKA